MINDKRGKNSTAHGRKDSGVSEIIGDILILGITVVLFTSIFFYVNAIPTPTAQTYADFQATVTQPVAHGLTFQEILNITHLGGQNLNSGTTSIVVQINQTTFVYQLPEGNSVGTTGILGPWTQSQWETNQVWSVNQTNITSGAVVAISIINTASNYVVWSAVLTGKSNIATVVIQRAYASPSPVTPGKKLTVTAVVLGNVKYVNASVYYLNSTVGNLPLGLSGGIYTGYFYTLKTLVSGQYYPIQINATSHNGQETNYTFSTLVANNGPDIITASINPNPSTPNSYFNITAYVVDSNISQFNPASGFGSVTVAPYGTPILTNITKGSTVHMVPSAYTGIFTYPGRVNPNNYGFETFAVNATDIQGNSVSFYITIVVISALNPNLNSSYPSTYLGPTSMTYSQFSWNESGSSIYHTGYEIPASYVDGGPGIYFHIVLENHNSSIAINLNYISDIYFLFNQAGNPGKFAFSDAFILNSTTYRVLGTSTISLPANVPVNVTFGTAGNGGIPLTNSGTNSFMSIKVSGTDYPASGELSFNSIMLFGTLTNSSTGALISQYGQAIPFTGIYWY